MHGPNRIGRVEVSVVCEGYAPLDLSDEMPGAEVDWGAERARLLGLQCDGRVASERPSNVATERKQRHR